MWYDNLPFIGIKYYTKLSDYTMRFIRSLFPRTAAQVVGRRVTVDLPLFGINGIVAKVDTGAFSGALHATRIREVQSEQGPKLEFAPLNRTDQLVLTENFRKKRVKSSNGSTSTRYVIDTDVRILGQTLPMTITLANRSSMKYPMIVGRKFFNTHGFLIDVSHGSK